MKQTCNSQHLLVRLPNWIGDAVMATPTMYRLRKQLPNAHFTALAKPPILELYKGLPFFDSTIPFIEKNTVQTSLKEIKPDCGLLLTGSFSSAWQFFRAHIPRRIGFRCHFRSLLLTDSIPLSHDETMHDVLRYQSLLEPFGLHPVENVELMLYVQQEEQEAMRSRLKEHGIHPWHTLVVINPGAAYGEAKCWPKKYFKEVATQLAKQPNLYCLIVGSDAARPLAQEISSHMPEKILSLAGQTTLRELMATLSLADCVLTNDSGPMHIAAALKRPLIALFGSTNPLRTGPWHTGNVLYEKVECSPCYRRVCPRDFRCMKQITPEKVLDAIYLALLEKE